MYDSSAKAFDVEATESAALPKFRLHQYQKDVLKRVTAELGGGKRVLMQMPTASGKTVTAAELVKREAKEGKVWFVCHRREIIRQTVRAFERHGIRCGVIAPGYDYEPDVDVQIASIDTLRFRVKKYRAPRTIIIDEAHHIPAKSWAALFKRFKKARKVGLTATPERLDGKGLSDYFDVLVCGPSIKKLMEDGFLSKFRWFAPSEPDLKKAKIKFGDYDKNDIDKIMNTPVIIGDAIDHYIKHAKGTRALVFATSVDASKSIMRRFKRRGILAAHVDGTTPTEQRDQAVADLESGKIKVLSNYGVFTEGFDLPVIDTVILMRPTRSLALYLQMVGRGLRVAEGKGLTTVLDHAGLVFDHGFPHEEWQWSLEGGARAKRIAEFKERNERIRKCPECGHAPEEREAVCSECGFEYPTGSQIGEFDASLIRIVGDFDGTVSVSAFAKEIGSTSTTVGAWVSSGYLPSRMGRVVYDDAIDIIRNKKCSQITKWFRWHEITSLSNYAGINRFAGLAKISAFSVRKLLKRGVLPLSDNGSIIVDKALDWIAKNYAPKNQKPRGNGSDGFIQVKDFAKLYRTSAKQIAKWRKMGMPCAKNGWPHARKAADWIANPKNLQYPYRVPPYALKNWREYESGYAFRVRLGLKSDKIINQLIKAGMPAAYNGWVNPKEAIPWVRENYRPPATSHLADEFRPKGFESPKDFSRRTGVRIDTIRRWIKDGMPSDINNSFVNILPALGWIEQYKPHCGISALKQKTTNPTIRRIKKHTYTGGQKKLTSKSKKESK